MKSVNDKHKFFYNFSKVNKSVTANINENLKEYNVTRSEVPFFACLYNQDNVTQEHISKVLSLNEGTVTRALVRLEKKEFIERIPNPEDKRKRMVSLTEKGKDISEMLLKEQIKFEEKIFADFSEEELDDFFNYLHKIYVVLSENFC